MEAEKARVKRPVLESILGEFTIVMYAKGWH